MGSAWQCQPNSPGKVTKIIEESSAQDSDHHTQTSQYTGHPVNVILMIGDGMGLSQISAGWIAKNGTLQLERCQAIGLSKTTSSDNLITDSAAGATAFSTGKKTFNGAIGVDKDSVPAPTILEIAEANNRSTGLVSMCSITHATPASFIAHQPSRNMDQDIASDFLNTDIDVFIGGGKTFFENRTDGRNLLDDLKNNDYSVKTGIRSIAKTQSGKLAGFLADMHPPKISEGRGQMLTLASITAIGLLSQNKNGFFLMIEGSQIDWAGHANDSEYLVQEMVDFDDAIGKVLDFAEKDKNTLVIITADHETGGYSVTAGDLDSGTVTGSFSTGYHTPVMVPVFAFGPGAEKFAGIYHNNTIFNKMKAAMKLDQVTL